MRSFSSSVHNVLGVEQPQVNGNDYLKRLKSKIHTFTDGLIRSVKYIFDDERSLSEGNGSGNDDARCSLHKAAMNGNWETAEQLERENLGILSVVISEDRNETALHIATRCNQVGFVQKLVARLSDEDLGIENSYGNTALCIAATLGGLDIAKSMVEKRKDLIGGSRNVTPVLIAARYKHNDMVSYLLSQKDHIAPEMELELLVGAISANHYDIALIILKGKDWLATKLDINQDTLLHTLLHIMARKPNTIASYKMTAKWQSCIEKSVFKCLCKKTTMEIKAHQMVANMWSIVKTNATSKENLMNFVIHPSSMLHDAARVGNVEFLEILLHENPDLLRIFDNDGKSIFHVAVENRQEGVFNLIYDMKLFNPDDLLYYFDAKKISLLELAAKSANPKHLDRVSGAVFQMHSELLWFKVVENIVELTTRVKRSGGETAREIFTREHKELKEEGEKWVKRTANSCMLVATLIATVVFTAAFTVPGGKNESSGLPIFVEKKWFTVFVISDGIALVSSSTAILLFLSILTSRCAENDFLFWLPLELVCGLGSLFVSVLCMVLAFGAAFFLYYGKDTALLPLMITGMAAVPIFWFCVLQWKLWAHALVSLHASTVFCLLRNRKTSILKAITNGVFVR
ncbi:ankyrin repeat-containing protein At5g02620-like [Cucurbita pepo subsp. pepo]|uniref:ankyrin repeat-containing protein At5g02620-like n=1 Tax=Cucurbita pepo subsp. pepo TaxID=3664 RepID=UPI000C9D9842|nr:ankyrin repeat-containing protein At5g02620-like [Cucurbita pepo subsp. pepo]